MDSDKSSLESIEAGGVQHLLLDGRGVRAPTEQEYFRLALTKYFLSIKYFSNISLTNLGLGSLGGELVFIVVN